jgi:hypothetical protein
MNFISQLLGKGESLNINEETLPQNMALYFCLL